MIRFNGTKRCSDHRRQAMRRAAGRLLPAVASLALCAAVHCSATPSRPLQVRMKSSDREYEILREPKTGIEFPKTLSAWYEVYLCNVFSRQLPVRACQTRVHIACVDLIRN